MSDHDNVSDNAATATTDHVAEARERARQILSSEPHLGAVDDWRRSLVSARDAIILCWLTWVALHGLGDPPIGPAVLVAFAVGVALLMGISTARATHSQVQFYAAELDRERHEIREDFDHELDEIRALYAAKGFHGDLLERIVQTLGADEDRLLKVMMEEELGLQIYHMNHPVAVGLINFAGAAIAGLAMTLPLLWITTQQAHVWMPAGGVVLLMIVSVLSAMATRRRAIEFFAVGIVTAIVTGGAAYFLAQWLAPWVGIGSEG